MHLRKFYICRKQNIPRDCEGWEHQLKPKIFWATL